jgi:hypothetical protein
MNAESGLGRVVHFVIGLTVLSAGYAGVLLAVKFLIDAG